jgi:nucleoside-diphosphate-sugar epimerase
VFGPREKLTLFYLKPLLGNNSPTTLKDLVRYIDDITGKKPFFHHEVMQQGDAQHTCADITKAQKILNYNSGINFNEGLQEFYTWKS